ADDGGHLRRDAEDLGERGAELVLTLLDLARSDALARRERDLEHLAVVRRHRRAFEDRAEDRLAGRLQVFHQRGPAAAQHGHVDVARGGGRRARDLLPSRRALLTRDRFPSSALHGPVGGLGSFAAGSRWSLLSSARFFLRTLRGG